MYVCMYVCIYIGMYVCRFIGVAQMSSKLFVMLGLDSPIISVLIRGPRDSFRTGASGAYFLYKVDHAGRDRSGMLSWS